MEELVSGVFRGGAGIELPAPFPVLTYDEAMRDYGSDKPDLRVPLKLAELTDAVKDVDFKVFSGPANAPGGRVCGLRVPGGGSLTRGELDAYGEHATGLGAKRPARTKAQHPTHGRATPHSPHPTPHHPARLRPPPPSPPDPPP